MTSNNTPTPYVVSVSSYFNNDGEYVGWHAFDNPDDTNPYSLWHPNSNDPNPWIMFDFGKPTSVSGIKVRGRYNIPTQSPKSFVVEGSLDASTFDTILIVNDYPGVLPSGGNPPAFEYLFPLSTYRYYRLSNLRSSHNLPKYVGIQDIQFRIISKY